MKFFFLILIFSIFLNGCSLNPNSKIWTKTTKITQENKLNVKYVTDEEKILNKELNVGLKLDIKKFNYNKYEFDNLTNNFYSPGLRQIKRKSKFSFSRIKKFEQYQPEIAFNNENLIFFDNKGSILKFDKKSKLIWKKNYYKKSEIKNNPILFFSNNSKILVVADTLAKIYALDLATGKLIWSKKNNSPFNSQIKILDEKVYLVDSQNSIHCFSLNDGKRIWKFNTDKPLIKSQKKLSLVIKNEKVIFNNSIGDITAINTSDGKLVWQTPTQSSKIYKEAMFLNTSDLVIADNSLLFSDNTNNFFSIDIDTGTINWKQKLNSSLRSVSINEFIFSVTNEGYFVVLKNDGKIIRSTYLLKKIKKKKRKNFKFTGFVIGGNNIYLSSSLGRLFIINLTTGMVEDILKIDNEKISRPLIYKNNLYLTKNNSIIRIN